MKKYIIWLLFIVFLSSQVNADLSTNLTRYFALNSSSGDVAIDSIGVKNGSAYQGSWVTNGKNNNAWLTNSNNNLHINTSYQAPSNLNKLSINFWINLSGSTTGHYLLDVSHDVNSITYSYKGYGLSFYTDGGNVVDFTGNGCNLDWSTRKGWQMFTLTYTPSNLSLYLNGTVFCFNTTPTGNMQWTGGLFIMNAYDGGQYLENSYIDEIGIWNRTLNSSEINDLWNGGTGTFYPFVTDITPPIISDVYCTSCIPVDNSSVYGASPPSGVSLIDTTPTFNMTTDESATCAISKFNFNYSDMKTNGTNDCATTGGTSQICTIQSNLSLSVGNQCVYIGCKDGSGNENSSSSSGCLNTTISDSILPSVIINSPLSQWYNSDFIVNATVTDDVAVSTVQYRYENSTVNGSWVSMSNPSGNDWNATFNITSVSDGNYTFRINATDSSGNSNTTATVTNIAIDNTIPQISIAGGTAANNSWFNRTWIYVNVSVTEVNFKNITFYLYNTTGLVNETSYSSQINNTNFTNLNADSIYYYNVSVRDYAGNINSTETRTITLDSIASSIALNSPADNLNTTASSINFNWTATDNLDTGLSCNLTIDGVVNVSLIESANGSATNYTVSGIAEGTHQWNVTCADNATNVNSSATRTFTRDITAPSVSLNLANNTWQQSGLVNFSYTATDSRGISSCILYGNFNGSWLSNLTDSLVSSGVQDWFLLNLTNSSYLWNVWCNDTLNNGAFNATNFSVYVDTIKPSISLNAPADNFNTTSSSINFNWTATDNLDSGLSCNLTIDGVVNVSLIESTNGSATNYTVSGIAEGSHQWNVTCMDNATNVNTSLTRTFTRDITAPVISNISNTSITSSGTTITWNTDESANSTVYYGTTVNLTSNISNTTFATLHTFLLTELFASTIYYYNVSSCDILGNCVTNGTHNFTTTSIASQATSSGGGGGGGTSGTTCKDKVFIYKECFYLNKELNACIKGCPDKYMCQNYTCIFNENHIIDKLKNISMIEEKLTFFQKLKNSFSQLFAFSIISEEISKNNKCDSFNKLYNQCYHYSITNKCISGCEYGEICKGTYCYEKKLINKNSTFSLKKMLNNFASLFIYNDIQSSKATVETIELKSKEINLTKEFKDIFKRNLLYAVIIIMIIVVILGIIKFGFFVFFTNRIVQILTLIALMTLVLLWRYGII